MALPIVRVTAEGEGEARNIRVSRGTKIGDLKNKLSEILGRPIEAISLYHGHRKVGNN